MLIGRNKGDFPVLNLDYLLLLLVYDIKMFKSGVITQNVDRLHKKAGSKSVVELHGCAYDVKCMKCDYMLPRHDFQNTLIQLNPSFSVERIEMRPDADVELSQVQYLKIEILSNFIDNKFVYIS